MADILPPEVFGTHGIHRRLAAASPDHPQVLFAVAFRDEAQDLGNFIIHRSILNDLLI